MRYSLLSTTLGLLLLFVSTATAVGQDATAPAPTDTPTDTPTVVLPSETPVPTETPTPSPTASALPTVTETATATETPTVAPTAAATATQPAPSRTPSPSQTASGTTATPDPSAPVLLAAGDVATCNGTGDERTAALLDGLPGTIALLGDGAYPNGSAGDYTSCYDPTWGRHKGRTRPAPGNHDYPGGTGYFGYFEAAAGDPSTGWYSYDLGGWHVIVLNSNLTMATGSPQEQWLRADLAANPAPCTLAYWHHARFSSGTTHAGKPGAQPLWQALYEAGADVVLAAHEHNYERFAPQDQSGAADPAFGLRQFVVGVGGGGFYPFGSPAPNSEVRQNDTFGVLKLDLRPDGYDWQFVPEAGKAFADEGSGACHGAPPVASSTATATKTPSTFSPTPTSTPSLVPTSGGGQGTGTGTTLIFAPDADARVAQANPTSNYGGSSTLRVDGGVDPDVETYLRFTASGLTGTVQVAKLRLWVTTGSADGPAVLSCADVSWGERAITWATKPSRTGPRDDKGMVAANAWVEFDVTPFVLGNGKFCFALATESNDGLDFHARENANKPQLVVVHAAPAGTTATATITPSATITPPATATPTPTPAATATMTPSATITPPATATPTPTPAATATPGAQGNMLILAPQADARVAEASPAMNFGTATTLRVDGGSDPDVESYLRFAVANVGGPVQRATLRLWATSGTGNGPVLFAASSNWTETGITWNARPSRSGAAVDDKGALASSAWTEYDVTSLVTGNGTFTFALVPQSSDGVDFVSRENPTVANRPQLVLTLAAVSTPTPSAPFGGAFQISAYYYAWFGAAWRPWQEGYLRGKLSP